MGYVGRHAYFLEDTPRSMSQRAYERFFARGSTEALTGIFNERVRLATFYLVAEERKIVRILKEEYLVVAVDELGKLDRAAFDEHLHDAANLVSNSLVGNLLVPPMASASVVDASTRFAYARHSWTPDKEHRRALLALWKLPMWW